MIKNLLIISRDWEIYKTRFEANKGLHKHICLIGASEAPTDQMLNNAELIIGEPDLTAKFVSHCPKLSWLQSTWAGNNKLQALQKHDYTLTGVKGVFGLQMVEYVLSYILYFTRRIEEFNTLKQSHTWSQLPCKTLSNYSIGILGFGSIGQELAQRLLQFNMTVNALSRSKKHLDNINEFTYQELPQFLSTCDFIISLLPDTPTTKGLCNSLFFSQMKKGSVFMNAGRGNAVDSPKSLIEALNNEWLSAAVLDVFEEEPVPKDHPYYNTENLYMTCHTAAISDPHQVFDLFETNAQLYSKGEPLLYEHDFTQGY